MHVHDTTETRMKVFPERLGSLRTGSCDHCTEQGGEISQDNTSVRLGQDGQQRGHHLIYCCEKWIPGYVIVAIFFCCYHIKWWYMCLFWMTGWMLYSQPHHQDKMLEANIALNHSDIHIFTHMFTFTYLWLMFMTLDAFDETSRQFSATSVVTEPWYFRREVHLQKCFWQLKQAFF